MPTKKATEKKSVKKVASKPVVKAVEKKIEVRDAEAKKSHVVVETKKTDSCKVEWECNCGCKCKCCMKTVIMILLLINLVLAIIVCVRSFTRSAWTLETAKVGWKENMEKVIQLYKSDYYVSTQKDSIDAYLAQINPTDDTEEVEDAE